jgi:hypothetical protein
MTDIVKFSMVKYNRKKEKDGKIMGYFDEFSGFIDEEQTKALEEERVRLLNERLAYRLRNFTYEETLQGLYRVLSGSAVNNEFAESGLTFA